MFANLIASRPVRDRRLAPWLIAAAVHIPALYLLAQTEAGRRLIDSGDELRQPFVVIDEPPVFIVAPAFSEQRSVSGTGGAVTPRPAGDNRQSIPIEGTPAEQQRAAVRSVVTPDWRVADVLVAPTVDARLLGPTQPVPLSAAEAVRARIEERIAPIKDSLAAASAAASRARDWTREEQGERWGVSPGSLHLGTMTLKLGSASNGGPVPNLIVPPPGRREETNALLRSWQDIEMQSSRAEVRTRFDARVKEIRARNDSTVKKAPATSRPKGDQASAVE